MQEMQGFSFNNEQGISVVFILNSVMG